MGNIVPNIALGRVAAWHDNVEFNTPAPSGLWVTLHTGVATDDSLRDCNTLVEIATYVPEATHAGYAPKLLTDADIVAAVVNDTTNTVAATVPNQIWTAVAAGLDITRLVISYDDDVAAMANAIPIGVYDFPVTPNGGPITAQMNANGTFTAA